VTLRTGLAAYWKLDGAAAGVWPDAHGAHDLVSAGEEPVALGSGILDGAMNLGEQAWVAGYHLETAVTALLDPSGDFTVSAWINPVNRDWQDEPVFRIAGAGGAECFFISTRVWSGSGELYCTLAAAGGGEGVSCGGTTPVPGGAWTHCVAVREAGALCLYLNGVEDGAEAVPPEFTPASGLSGVVQLGTTGAAQNFPGLIDEVGFWRRALTPAEVARLYNGGAALAYELFG
jgi:hypothetical protein